MDRNEKKNKGERGNIVNETVEISDLVNRLPLEVYSGEEFLDRKVATSDVSRPGLELTGYFRYYPKDRIQLLGRKEVSFCEEMTTDELRIVMNKLCDESTPAFVFSRGMQPISELVEAANKKEIPVLISEIATSRLSGIISNYLGDQLAQRESIHGVLVDVYGLGVLIQGSSGIGKSETGLELIKKGHRLVADDRVDVYRQDERTLIGEAPKVLENMMEIRGIGIIDVMTLFGASAVRSSSEVQLVVQLENWSKDKKFDRLGGAEERVDLGGVSIPKIAIPVSTGRNVAIIIEVAAMNFRAKTMGYDATKIFDARLSRLIEENTKENQ